MEYYEKFFDIVKDYISKYNKGNEFNDILNLKIVTCIDTYMRNYFFNKENLKKNKEIKEEFWNLLNKEIYILAIKNVKKQYLSTYQKCVLFCAKHRLFYGLRFLNKFKNFIKSM